MRAALRSEPAVFNTVLVDNLAKPTVVSGGVTSKDSAAFMGSFKQHIRDMFANLGNDTYRKPVIAKLTDFSQAGWLTTVDHWVSEMHAVNAWIFTGTNKRVSFGLIRVANVTTAKRVARHLAKSRPHAKIACYHSNNLAIARYLQEARLDTLLSRHNGNAYIEADPEIRAIVENCVLDDVQFIVVASPVEEIGRDHDFDWAIVEPSSVQSIVQTAGRVNRHRLLILTNPNIAILQCNFRAVTQIERGKRGRVFVNPGLESASSTEYKHHDLCTLLPPMPVFEAVDARLRFDGCKFAEYDDASLENVLAELEGPLFAIDSTMFLAENLYTRYQLRKRQRKQTWVIIEDKFHLQTKVDRNGIKKEELVSMNSAVARTERVSNDWLVWDTTDLVAACTQRDISVAAGMTLDIPDYFKEGEYPSIQLEYDCSFGFSQGEP
jgi:CRISPR-associated endonuclease/helicase Cas3